MLGSLHMLSNDQSVPALGIDQKRVEALGRMFFAAKVDQKSDVSDFIQADDPNDKFWESHVLRFPSAWPEKVHLPVTVADPSKLLLSDKYRLLALDELVLAFWAFAGFAVNPACMHGLHCRAGLEWPNAYAFVH